MINLRREFVTRVRTVLRSALGLAPHFGWTTTQREEALWTAIRYLQANKVVGNYAEFGVWRGDTLATAYRLARGLSGALEPPFYAFDSFAGFPELHEKDRHPQFEAGGRSFSRARFEANLRDRGVNLEHVRTYSGWYRESLALGAQADGEIPEGKFALAFCDADLFESTSEILPFLAPRMMCGGLVLFDNWNCFGADPSRGERAAVADFLSKRSDVELIPVYSFDWHGVAFAWHSGRGDFRHLAGLTSLQGGTSSI